MIYLDLYDYLPFLFSTKDIGLFSMCLMKAVQPITWETGMGWGEGRLQGQQEAGGTWPTGPPTRRLGSL